MTGAVIIAILSLFTAALCTIVAILYRGGFIQVYWHSFIAFALVMLGLGIFYTARAISIVYDVNLYQTFVNYSRVFVLCGHRRDHGGDGHICPEVDCKWNGVGYGIR